MIMKRCKSCGLPLIRKRYESGRLEPKQKFKSRKYCDKDCAIARFELASPAVPPILPLAYRDGGNWLAAGGSIDQNPYAEGMALYRSWNAGYLEAHYGKLEAGERRIAA